MKKILYILVAAGCAVLSVSCSEDMLNTSPAGSLSGSEIFADSDKAQSAVDGIYRLMYANGWSSGWPHEHPGLAGFTGCRPPREPSAVLSARPDGGFPLGALRGCLAGDF